METLPPVSSPVRLGLVGLNWGERVARAAAKVPGVVIDGCFARTASAREEFAARHHCEAFSTYEAMIANARFDGIIVMTPNASHRDLTLAALAAGKHVLVTKPIAANLADATAMIAAARERGRLLVVGHQARRHPGVRAIKRLLERGDL